MIFRDRCYYHVTKLQVSRIFASGIFDSFFFNLPSEHCPRSLVFRLPTCTFPSVYMSQISVGTYLTVLENVRP